MTRLLTAGLLVALFVLGSPLAPPPPAHADSAPVLFLVTPWGVVVVTEGDPDTPDFTDGGGRHYTVRDASGNEIDVDANWLSEFLFNALGNLFDLTK